MIDLSVHDVLRLKDEFDRPEFLTYNPLTLAVSQAIAYPPSIVVIRNLDDLPYGMLLKQLSLVMCILTAMSLEHDKSATEKFMTILCNQIARLKDEIQVCIGNTAMMDRVLTCLDPGLYYWPSVRATAGP